MKDRHGIMVDAQDAIHRTEKIRVISKMSLGQMSLGQVSALDHRSESASIRASFGPRTGQFNVGQCLHM